MEKLNEFFDLLRGGLLEGAFVKLSLGNYQGTKIELKKIFCKKILIKREEKLSFTYQYKTKDIVKNYDEAEALKLIKYFINDFHTGSLFVTGVEISYEYRRDDIFIKRREDETIAPATLSHDREKIRLVQPKGKTYLHDLKITDEKGEVYKNAQDKFRQINKYIEILSPLVKNFPEDQKLNIVDMGSGKGYLTFALYDYLLEAGRQSDVSGIEYREDMVNLCNNIADKSGFDGLKFIKSSIEEFASENIDVLIALHACDTATDDAIYKGIKAGAGVIVVAPCCHKQIRREIEKNKPGNDLDFATRHGIFMERHAEMITDGLRAMILEYCGYATKVFEFISDAHTAKNVMIVATKKSDAQVDKTAIKKKISDAKTYFGITNHHLEKVMG